MSKFSMKKALAVLCGATSAVALGASAITAFAQETVTEEAPAGDKAVFVADQVYAEPGEEVSYNVYLYNNPGYTTSGTTLIYDADFAATPLEILVDEYGTSAEYEDGPCLSKLNQSTSLNLEKHLWCLGTTGQSKPNKNNGIVYTVTFTVPKDAKPGTTWTMNLEVDKFMDQASEPLPVADPINGWIKIKGDTPTPPDTTTKPTETTTSSTTTETTTKSTETTSSTTETTTSKSGSGETTTTTKPSGTTTTTTKKPAAGVTTASAVKTGDAGVGVATAALALAVVAGTATAIIKKKED